MTRDQGRHAQASFAVALGWLAAAAAGCASPNASPAPAASSPEDTDTNASKIFQGVKTLSTPVVRIEWRHQKRGRMPQELSCTATFIAQNWLLTAAHCVPNATDQNQPPAIPFENTIPSNRATTYQIDIVQQTSGGTTRDFKLLNGGKDLWVTSYPYKLYAGTDTDSNAERDIALIYVDPKYGSLLNDPELNALPIGAVKPVGTMDLIGWGTTSNGSSVSNDPLAPPNGGRITVTDGDVSAEKFSTVVTPTGPRICGGDSCGPILSLVDGTFVISGVNSGAARALHTDCPIVGAGMSWSRVDTKLKWIQEVMTKSHNSSCRTFHASTPTAYTQCWTTRCDNVTVKCKAGQTCQGLALPTLGTCAP